ncbi:hypothetical protein RCO48_24055 [Peribacillus frigoritolerans]|nr:hypothetical protein [Peribacillus frigoritolerans]
MAGGCWIAISTWFFPKVSRPAEEQRPLIKGARLLQDKQPAGNKPAVDSRKLGAY